MPSRDQVNYFGAGPAPLPTEVLEQASKVLLNYKDTGVGVAEISHRGSDASEIINHAKSCLRELLEIPDSDGPDGYEIMFLHGGGSGEFSAVVYNMVSAWVGKQLKKLGGWDGSDVASHPGIQKLKEAVKRMRLDYFVTGSWSMRAFGEAERLVGSEYVNLVTDSRKHRDGKFGVIADQSTWNHTTNEDDCVFTYYCDNETVDGVEFQSAPTGHNLVADMSSNFLSRPVDVKKYAAIFAGAQKNVGLTGITIAIISKAFLPPHAEMADPKVLRALGLPNAPIVFDWPTIAKNNSLYNTLPIFDIWVAGRVMQRTLDLFPPSTKPRLAGQEAESNKKASMLYSVLDSSDVYNVVPDKSARSRMNLCFRVKNGDADAEKAFLQGAESRGLLAIKGHRSVGGMRISNYNAVPVDAVEKLAQYLQDFAKQS